MPKILDIKEVKLRSVNNKFNKNFSLTSVYRDLKEYLSIQVKPIRLPPPYKVIIKFDSYLDIDNPVKLILDAIKSVITDDKDILRLTVIKTPIKRGHAGRLKVYIATISSNK